MNDQEARDRDIELLEKIAGGDRAAFAEFYDRHSLVMHSLACKILRDTSEAEDVMQETFIQIWEKAGQFDKTLGNAFGWSVKLLRNKAIDRLRAAQRRLHLAEEAAVAEGLAKVDDTVSEALYGNEKAALIHSAILTLADDQRRAIELAYFAGLTQHEIAEKLNQPLGTVKARVRRGLLKLRDELEGLL